MKKQLLTYIFIFLLSITIVFGNSVETMNPADVVTEALQDAEAKFDHVNINSYVVLSDEFLTIDNSSKICNDISEKLDMKETNISKEESEEFNLITLTGIIQEGIHGTIIIQSSRYGDFRESSMVIDIIGTTEEYDIARLCDKIRGVLNTYGDAKLNINLAGYYDGPLENKELKEKVNKAFQKAGAKKVEGIEDDELISITGYTPKIEENIKYCGKTANINIATRFNSYENKTYIWIGTPLIVLEY